VRDLPGVGEPSEEWAGGRLCGYKLPGEVGCLRDAIWHGIVLDDACEDVELAMSSCDEHLPAMKASSADFIHRLKHPCGIDGSKFRWPENYCYTDWDEQAEFAAVAGLAATS
jgi:hypothetical protein